MERYRIKNKIMLSFENGQEQFDFIIHPDDGYDVEREGDTIWIRRFDREKAKELDYSFDCEHIIRAEDPDRVESITTANAIEMYLDRGDIEKV